MDTHHIQSIEATATSLLLLVPLFPLLGAIFNGLLTLAFAHTEKGAPRQLVTGVALGAPVLSFLTSVVLFFQLRGLGEEARLMTQHVATWIKAGAIDLGIDFMLDPLSAVMILVVTFIGSLIHLYSVGYMSHDRGFSRFFTYLNLFTFSMLVLVLGKSLPMRFVGWDGVGVCSYLLIGFWFQDLDKAYAGNKAFIANRVGDFGFLIGIFYLFTQTLAHGGATLDFVELSRFFASLPQDGTTTTVATIAGLCLFIGAMGKSAQVPLHVWLADAMAGPTPVSALIHAATMVTAGIYMVSRMHFVYDLSPIASSMIITLGALTALLAASIAITQRDIKRVLAYSTVSQLGYMFVGAGVGAYSAGMFHVFTHAFFKALLFLGAGSVIHAMHEEQDIWKMGGLKSKLPVTFWTMLIATVAIAGIPPLAGFFSKDEILWQAFVRGHHVAYGVLLVTAGITAYYMFRMLFLTFFGVPRVQEKFDHAHESPWVMTLPLVLLAIGTCVVGLLGIPHVLSGTHPIFAHWLHPVLHETEVVGSIPLEIGLMGLSIVVAGTGIFIAFLRYAGATPASEPVTAAWWDVLRNKWFLDEWIDAILIKPLLYLSNMFFKTVVEDELVTGSMVTSARAYSGLAGMLRTLQTGIVRHYALMMLVGISLLALLLSARLPGAGGGH